MYQAILFLPLAGAVLAGFFGSLVHIASARTWEVITCSFMVVAAVLSWVAFFDVAAGHNTVETIRLWTWIDSGALEVDWSIRVDTLTAVMLVVVNTVSALVHIYSIGYMHDDSDRARFFSYLSLFTFAMLMLVTADNLVQLFFGWEGVGLASYLLIGFWYKKASANAAAIKAFIVNRVGDFGFLLGVFAVFFLFDSVDFNTIFNAVKANEVIGAKLPFTEGGPIQSLSAVFFGYEVHALTLACLLLFIGAMGKSAQLFLHTWLPDAMEGPTPVSALIHAATMVTAGVFLVCRMSPLFEYAPDALMVVTIIGATTAIFAATIGLAQNDIKRVIAYSTCSQLGYMFFAAGVSAYGIAMFHLFTHAFFKALLFLGAGSVIHAMSGEQDMRKMGGITQYLPLTFLMMLIGTASLTGLGLPLAAIGLPNIGFAGFHSKDLVIESAFAAGTPWGIYAFWLGLATALLTAIYSWRVVFMTFTGAPRASREVMHHVHESPPSMLWPLFILAAGAAFAGLAFSGYFTDPAFWGDSLFVLQNEASHAAAPAAGHAGEAAAAATAQTAQTETLADAAHGAVHHHVPAWVATAPFAAGISGLLIAWFFYVQRPDIPRRMGENMGPVHTLFYRKWYFDELYDFLFVRPAMWLGRTLWKVGDGRIIDGLGPDGISARVVDVTRALVRLQTGYLYHYAFAMLIGIAIAATWFMYRGGLLP
jgi:NADH-quinone oxidoreductase subunit L